MVLKTIFDDPLGGKVLADQKSCSKTNQTLLRVHLQWGWNGQLGSHGMGCGGVNAGGCQRDGGCEQGHWWW